MRLPPSPSTRLERRRLLDRAWQRYVLDGIVPAELGAEIRASWQRAREAYRIDPGLKQPLHVLSPEALEERRRADDVLALAAPILRSFAERLGRSGHVLAWLDGDGFMLTLDGDARVVELVHGIDFRPGVSWAEDSAGTNGPGTALAAMKPVEVFASEHFVAAWQGWSCAAAPVLVPGQPGPVGLVDITGPWELQPRGAILTAKAIAAAVEERLRAVVSVRDEVVRYAFRAAQGSGEALVAVDGRGRVIAANDAAARRRVVDGGALPDEVRDALAVTLRGAPGERRLEAPDGRAFVAAPVEFEGRRVGAILRVEEPARAPRGRARASARYDLGRVLGRSAPLRRAVDLARTAAANDLPVILAGETGTGKELFAHAIHAASGRRAGPFVAVNCGAIPAQLVEAELFGYEAGTFTGARREGNAGRFEDADGGTLFLDELAELPAAAQTALLRVLQEREVVRLGGSAPRPVDVRVVAATNRPLAAEVAAGRFRRDLLYRLDVLSIAVPPLRERGEDVELLAAVFLAEAEGEVGRRGLTLAEDALAALRRHPWPGNVRELRNVILRAAATAPRSRIEAEDLRLDGAAAAAGSPDEPAPPPAAPAPTVSAPAPAGGEGGAAGGERPPGTLRDTLRDSEREVLRAALEACGWNYARAAQRLGVSRMTLYRRLARCGISRAGEGG